MTTAIEQLDIQAMLQTMADQLREQFAESQPLLVGIHSGGVWVAKALTELLGDDFFDGQLGTLNIAYYRDDFTRIGMHPQVTPSDLPFSVDDRDLVLIDDVLHSGRTIRAGLNEIFDYGRPASVTLAVLIERSGRELPIQADIVGQSLTLDSEQHIKLTKQDQQLTLELKNIEAKT